MSSDTARGNPWLRLAGVLVRVAIVGGLLVYLLAMVLSQWGELRGKVVGAKVPFVGAAIFFHLFSMVFLGLLWRELVGALGHKLRVVPAIRMQWLAALGKYVPGKISTTLGKMYLGGVDGVGRKLVGLGCVYEILFCSIGSGLVVLMSIVYGSLHGIRAFTVPAAGLVATLLICVHPRIMLPAVNWVLRRLKREPIENGLTYPQTVLFSLGYAMPYVLGGASEYAMVRAFFDVDPRFMIDVMGLGALSTALGFAALFAPGGLGVRDGILAKGLVLLPLGINAAGGALVALAARALGSAMDLASGVVSVAMYGGLPWKRRGDDG